jgi:integrase
MGMTISQADVKRLGIGRHAAGDGLYLQVKNGGRSWVYKYPRLDNPRKFREMGLGSADALTLADAKELAIDARRLRAKGIDPIDARIAEKAEKQAAAAQPGKTFKHCAAEFLDLHLSGFRNGKHRQQWQNTLATYVYPARLEGRAATFGDTLVAEIDAAFVLAVLRPIWTEKNETTRRLRGRIERIIAAAMAAGHRPRELNPAAWRGHLDQYFPKKKKRAVRHHPAMPYADVPAFMARLRGKTSVSARALEYTILCAARTNETIAATWPEIEDDTGTWVIPKERMKAERPHRVPLCERAAEIVAERASVREEDCPFLFAGLRAGQMSDMTMLNLLKDMGHADLTVHGFRSSFRDWAAECTDFPNEVVEMALAHIVADATEAAYRRGDLFAKRRALMQAWADYCTTPPAEKVDGDNVVPIRKAG